MGPRLYQRLAGWWPLLSGCFAEAGFEVTCFTDPWRREIFIGSHREPHPPL